MSINNFTNPFVDTSKYIYHYTSAETLINYILPQKALRFSHLNSTNDPEESRYHIMQYIDDLDMGVDYFAQNNNKILQIANGIKQNIRLICFSQDDEEFDVKNGLFSNKGYARPRMWAQYAQNHQGVCLVFDRDKIIKHFNRLFNTMIHFHGDVSYEPLIKLLGKTENINAQVGLASELNQSIDEIITERIYKYREIYYFSKHKDWQTEKEFRLVVKDDMNVETFLSIDGILQYIILGHKFDIKLKKPIEIIANIFEEKPQILKFGHNGSNYSFVDDLDQ